MATGNNAITIVHVYGVLKFFALVALIRAVVLSGIWAVKKVTR